MKRSQLKFEPVRFADGKLLLIDQRKLPNQLIVKKLTTVSEVWHAIKNLTVRGAPAIGITAAYGVYLAVSKRHYSSGEALVHDLVRQGTYLKSARPTAVNLAWAVERVIEKAALLSEEKSVSELKKIILREAIQIHEEDIAMCFAIGQHGEKLIKSGDSILTHCNAGGLATSGYGTALSPIFEAWRRKKRIKVFADETRPILQGARLTMWEFVQYKIPATLICDNMAATLMEQGRITKVIVGADRIAVNGDTANKIGTYSVACLAKMHKIPFYVAAPSSTLDFKKKHGSEIPIELRGAEEVTKMGGRKIAPAQIRVHNPAFDVTPHSLIAGFITEKGIVKPPFKSLR